MSKKVITKLAPEDVDFVWVAGHYDIHLEGICRYENQICAFMAAGGGWNDEADDYHPVYYDIYQLSFWEKGKWLLDKKMFELCVGYHWTYPQATQMRAWKLRKPEFLYKMLYRSYSSGLSYQ
jgi:hypothetical protein